MLITIWKKKEPDKGIIRYIRLLDNHYKKMQELNKNRDPKENAKKVKNEIDRKRKDI